MNSTYSSIGNLLRALRTRNGWTLREMSQRCGIPLSTLSKVEHDRLTLSYDKLQQISTRLGLRMSELFAEPDHEADSKGSGRRSIGTVQGALRVTTPNYDHFYMCPELSRKRMIPVLTRVRAKTLEAFGPLVRHSGEEYVHVIEGAAVIHTEFYEPAVLREGEGVYLDSNMGHAYLAADGCEEAVLLGVCSSPDDHLQESLMTLYGIDAIAKRSGKPSKAKAAEKRPNAKVSGSRTMSDK